MNNFDLSFLGKELKKRGAELIGVGAIQKKGYEFVCSCGRPASSAWHMLYSGSSGAYLCAVCQAKYHEKKSKINKSYDFRSALKQVGSEFIKLEFVSSEIQTRKLFFYEFKCANCGERHRKPFFNIGTRKRGLCLECSEEYKILSHNELIIKNHNDTSFQGLKQQVKENKGEFLNFIYHPYFKSPVMYSFKCSCGKEFKRSTMTRRNWNLTHGLCYDCEDEIAEANKIKTYKKTNEAHLKIHFVSDGDWYCSRAKPNKNFKITSDPDKVTCGFCKVQLRKHNIKKLNP